MCCPLAFLEEIIAVFYVTLLQIDIENDKNPEFSNFQSFYAILLKFHRLRVLECSKGSTIKKLVRPVDLRKR